MSWVRPGPPPLHYGPPFTAVEAHRPQVQPVPFSPLPSKQLPGYHGHIHPDALWGEEEVYLGPESGLGAIWEGWSRFLDELPEAG